MSRDSHSGLQCPHCRTHLALVAAPDSAPDPKTAPARPAAAVDQPFLVREEWSPPPVGEVLAQYAHLTKDTATALRGAARVRDSLNRARQAAARKRTEQRAARSA
ncbi:hypothetical protein [Actinomadura rugatobispora]|uniref:Uncharacterized protein n=1 Tax=Actinomadura rugatobispora TaxID=1994 RepID=A0ABW1AIT6_9ACTN|nr:hypothetical protein GCM10010200_047060 [Actinomadura rugatobispora]